MSCYALSEGAEPKQTIASTRSFGERDFQILSFSLGACLERLGKLALTEILAQVFWDDVSGVPSACFEDKIVCCHMGHACCAVEILFCTSILYQTEAKPLRGLRLEG